MRHSPMSPGVSGTPFASSGLTRQTPRRANFRSSCRSPGTPTSSAAPTTWSGCTPPCSSASPSASGPRGSPAWVACGTRPALDQGRPGHGRPAVQDPGDGPQGDRHDAVGVQRGPGVDGAGGEGARPSATSIELQGSVAVALGVRGEVEGEFGEEARLVVGDHSGRNRQRRGRKPPRPHRLVRPNDQYYWPSWIADIEPVLAVFRAVEINE